MNWKGIYSGWVKNYLDGSSYIATDIDIRRMRVSWRKSRNDGITSVGVKYGATIGEIYGLGEYWQSDMFVVNFPYSNNRLVRRNIQKKIEKEDRFVSILKTSNSVGLNYMSAIVSSSISGSASSSSNQTIITLTDGDIGKWFSLSLNIGKDKNRIEYHISKEML